MFMGQNQIVFQNTSQDATHLIRVRHVAWDGASGHQPHSLKQQQECEQEVEEFCGFFHVPTFAEKSSKTL